MKTRNLVSSLAGMALLVASSGAWADGTETLGPPLGITLADGTGIVAGGTGLIAQPGLISVDVPAGATVEQVLLYWEGQMSTDVAGDDTIVIDGNTVTGDLIGGQTFFFSGAWSSAFRADITGLGLVFPGPNALTVSGLAFDKANNGAGVVVIFDDGSDFSDIEIRDGVDLAFINFPIPRKDTIAQTFNFAPSAMARMADLSMFFSSVSGATSGGPGGFRPSSVEITVGGTTTLVSDALDSLDGEEWDTLNLMVPIPAGANMLTVQAFSRDDNATEYLPASLAWIAAGLSVPPPQAPEGCTPGYWKNHTIYKNRNAWVTYTPNQTFNSVFENAFPGKTLLQVLKQGGGGLNALGRHTVAALLNAANPDVAYPLTPGQVINKFDSVYPGSKKKYNWLKNKFENYNEAGCPNPIQP